MKRRLVRFTTEARRQLRTAHEWWRAHRDEPGVFVAQLRRAVVVLRANARIGAPYAHGRLPGLRRLFVQRVGQHMYYTVEGDEIRVHAIWHARRGRGPSLDR